MADPSTGQGASPPPPPDELKPWYYENWFLFPAFFMWPLWAILILRSPWHNSIRAGAVAWAMLIAGGYLIFLRTRERGTVDYTSLVFIIPGLVLTVITQVLWTRYRGTVLGRRGNGDASSTPRDDAPAGGTERSPARRRQGRGGRRRRTGRGWR